MNVANKSTGPLTGTLVTVGIIAAGIAVAWSVMALLRDAAHAPDVAAAVSVEPTGPAPAAKDPAPAPPAPPPVAAPETFTPPDPVDVARDDAVRAKELLFEATRAFIGGKCAQAAHKAKEAGVLDPNQKVEWRWFDGKCALADQDLDRARASLRIYRAQGRVPAKRADANQELRKLGDD